MFVVGWWKGWRTMCTHYELKSFSAVRSDLSHCSTEKRIASTVLFVLFDRPNWICIRKRFCCAWWSSWRRSRLWTLVCVLLALLRWWSPVRMSSYLHIALTLRSESYVSHLYVWAVPSFVFIEFIILTSSHKYASTQHYTSHFFVCANNVQSLRERFFLRHVLFVSSIVLRKLVCVRFQWNTLQLLWWLWLMQNLHSHPMNSLYLLCDSRSAQFRSTYVLCIFTRTILSSHGILNVWCVLHSAENAFYIPRSFYTIDAGGHQSQLSVIGARHVCIALCYKIGSYV